MKVLHLGALYAPSIGGCEVYIKELSEKLAEKGVDVTVFTSRAIHSDQLQRQPSEKSELLSKELINGVKVRRFSIYYLLNRVFLYIIYNVRGGYRMGKFLFKDKLRILISQPFIPKLILEIALFRPDIVLEINAAGSFLYYAYLAKKISKFPLIIVPCLHGDSDWANDSLIYKILKSAELIIALSKFEKDFLIKKGIVPEKIAVIGPGVKPFLDRKNNSGGFRKRHNVENNFIVSFVGRKVKGKGIEDLIDAMRIVWKTIPTARLILAGANSEYSKNIDNKIFSLEVFEKIRIITMDNLSEEEKNDLLEASDIFVMPSSVDSFGIVYLEAWRLGKPVIACRNTPQATIIEEGQDGLLVDSGNVADLASAISEFLLNKEMRTKYGENGRTKVLSNYNWDIISDRIFYHYHEVAKQRKK